MNHDNIRKRRLAVAALVGACAVLASCIEDVPTANSNLLRRSPSRQMMEVPCTASVVTRTVSCENGISLASNGQPGSAGLRKVIFGGQNDLIKLTSSNVSYNSGTQIFQFDVTVQNLTNEAIGTPDGTVSDPDGIQVFFASGPTVTSGSGSISVGNPDGIGNFTGTSQPYFAYHQILGKNAVSSAKTWQLIVPGSATSFSFTLYIETDVQYLLVINELLANPGGTIADANGEWVEIYNAGSRAVDLQGLVMADSAASGRRPYVLISDAAASLVVQPGSYFVFGNTKNTTNNGGVPVDYAYGAGMDFANSLDAFKIARVYGTDTLTIDRTQYASAAISAQDGVSRELKNPALDNSNMDGSNWADASVSSVYGDGGRGTPKAQNSQFVPNPMVAEPVPLGAAGTFGILAGTQVSCVTSGTVGGDIGISPGTALIGFPTCTLTGDTHLADPTAAQARLDLTAAYNALAGMACSELPTADLGGIVKRPGVYCSSEISLTGTLTLDGNADPNALFVFQSGDTFLTAGNIVLINGAQAKNVFFQVGSSAMLGNSSVIQGSILALVAITLNNTVTLNGRALARNGAVTLGTGDTITLP